MKIIKKVINQTSWQLLAKIISSISTLAVLSIISRQYGVEGVGLYTLALTYLAVFYLLADLGLNGHVLAELESNPKLAEQLWRFRIVWGLVLICLANIFVWLIPGFGVSLWLPVLAGSFSILGSAINNSCNLWFQKRLTYQLSSSPVILSALVMLPLYWLYGYLKLPVEYLTILVSVSWMLIGFVSLINVKRSVKWQLGAIDWRSIKNILISAWPMTATLVVNVIYFRVDVFFLNHFHSLTEVGVYNLAFQFFQNALVLPTFVMNSYYPLLLHRYQQTKELLNNEWFKAMSLLVAIGVVGLGVTFLVSDVLILLVSGLENDSAAVLKILSLSFPAFFGSSLAMWTLVLLKRYKTMLLIYVIGLAINVMLNSLFIPGYSYWAASWVTVGGEYLILALQLLIIYSTARKQS